MYNLFKLSKAAITINEHCDIHGHDLTGLAMEQRDPQWL